MNTDTTDTTDAIDSLPEPGSSSYPRNDSEHAERFAKEFGSDLRYVSAWKSWFLWDGTRWERDKVGAVMRLARRIPKILMDEANEITDADRRKAAWSRANQAGNEARLRAMVQLAGTESGIAATTEMFDADDFLLCVRNGVVDLRNGSFRVARREDYLTKQASVTCDREACCPRWIEHLRTVFAGDESLMSYLQTAVGYSLTGATS